MRWAATVGPVYVPDGKSILATTRTDCPASGSWTISKRDSPPLDKESAATKCRISAKVRERFKANPDDPFPVEEGVMLFCHRES